MSSLLKTQSVIALRIPWRDQSRMKPIKKAATNLAPPTTRGLGACMDSWRLFVSSNSFGFNYRIREQPGFYNSIEPLQVVSPKFPGQIWQAGPSRGHAAAESACLFRCFHPRRRSRNYFSRAKSSRYQRCRQTCYDEATPGSIPLTTVIVLAKSAHKCGPIPRRWALSAYPSQKKDTLSTFTSRRR
jgi:hypothetical protein